MRTGYEEESGTEITLGVGKLLILFFGLVLLCGIALGTGYWLGKNSAKLAAGQAPAQPTDAASQQAAIDKPGAGQPTAQKNADPAAPQKDAAPAQPAPASTDDLTFYQSVQQKDSHPQLTPQKKAEAPAPVQKATETKPPAPTLGAGYMVQVAAVRNEGDAKLLSETLRKQQYPTVIAQPGDKLYHVQVGPYADIKEAEAMRSRLINAGYTPILKH